MREGCFRITDNRQKESCLCSVPSQSICHPDMKYFQDDFLWVLDRNLQACRPPGQLLPYLHLQVHPGAGGRGVKDAFS